MLGEMMGNNSGSCKGYIHGDRDYSRVLTGDYFSSLLMAYCMLLVSLSAYASNVELLILSMVISGVMASVSFAVIGVSALIKGFNEAGLTFLSFSFVFVSMFIVLLAGGYFDGLKELSKTVTLVAFAGVPSIIMAIKGGYRERIWMG